ncbi:MAG: 4'-phosphopantetheinyl transferase superfamily protein [Cytophagales bacterium]|nr:MAG: 4'-phosphopantetheinyl transferase superfamily protein [Cytophagales bacterium]
MPVATVICHTTRIPDWQPWPGGPPPTDALTVLRLRVPTDPAQLAFWHHFLQSYEHEQAARFRQVTDQQRFMVGRGLFRQVGGLLLGQEPQAVGIEKTQFGKPFLPDAPNWYLNLSHSGEWVVLAVGRLPVGIDVEFLNRKFAIHDLVPTVLNAHEEARLTNHPDPHGFFFDCWTRKEALVKATGAGLTDTLVNVPATEGMHVVQDEWVGASGTWFVQPFFVDDLFPAALASVYMKEETSIRFYDYRH